jgi:hypothetical protein
LFIFYEMLVYLQILNFAGEASMKSTTIIILSTLALAGCQASGGGATRVFNVNKVASPTNPIKLDFAASLNPDCSSIGPIEVRVITQPTLGQVQISRAQDYPRFTSNNQRYRCNARAVPGVRTMYTPRGGAIGQDTIVTETFFPSGNSHRTTFNVTVR